MKRLVAILIALVLVAAFGLVGCEKKAETPAPVEQPAMTPTPPPPPPAPAPAPAPAPKPAPAKPAKK
jgi:hypothetical protein